MKDVLKKCKNSITSKTVTYDLTSPKCEADWNAYTYMGRRTPTIYLCLNWHNGISDLYCRKSNGEASKESILAHEWTHILAKTLDYSTYRGDDSKKMAKDDPDTAVNDADSYKYMYYYCLAA